ncbi:MAG: NERD domain-containing protein, partial [Gammaproteobacteria bacterium]
MGAAQMALMYPDTNITRVIFASSAEETFYEACRNSLSDAWIVYYSRTLSTVDRDSGMKDNEIDFVLYHPAYGVLVIEIKGGRIRHDTQSGKFYSINRYDETFEIKDPFQQALVWKSRFWRVLRNRNIKVPVSHAVAFPSVHESEIEESAAITPAIVIGRQKIASLASTLKNLVTHVQAARHLNFEDVAVELHDILWGKDFTSKLFLKDYLTSHDLRVKDVEVIQETLVQPIAASPRLAIEGEAGTGKTLVAILLARHFRSQGKRVLILSSNRLLNEYLKSEAGSEVEVKTYIELGESFAVHLLNPPPNFEGKREDWSQYEAPDRLIKAIAASERRYDVLLCDEAQDVQPFWWDGIEKVLADDDSRFLVFFDRSQGIFGAGGSEQGFVPEDVLPIAQPYFPLVYNYRTTREIATFSRNFRTGSKVMQSHCGRLGYMPEIIVYDDAQDCRGKLGRLFRKLFREEEVSTEDVTILSARNPKTAESVLKPTDVIARYKMRLLSTNRSQSSAAGVTRANSVDMTTISGFKGLETPIAILLNVSEYRLPIDNPIMSSLIYVACTRAKHMLYIMVQKDDPKRAVFEAALKNIKNTGGMVLEGSDANFEFAGTVSHYNPDRLGWLTVNDPAFEKSTIMFFPHDVKAAGLDGLKTGDNLRFRPRVEGHSSIATDLKLLKLEQKPEEVSLSADILEGSPVEDKIKELVEVDDLTKVVELPKPDNTLPAERAKSAKQSRHRRNSARTKTGGVAKIERENIPTNSAETAST